MASPPELPDRNSESGTTFYWCPACNMPHEKGKEPITCVLVGDLPPLEGRMTMPEIAPPRPATIRPGALLGERYVLEEKIGEGGMGQVYRARDIQAGRLVAVKLFRGQLEEDSPQAKRFVQEARIMASLTHPGITQVRDFGIDVGGRPYLVLELLEGETLEQIILEHAPLPVELACSLVCQVLATLSVVHASGVLHRDIKPANIFVSNVEGSRTVKLLDFGVSVRADTSEVRPANGGNLSGTPHYMAPHVIRGEAPDEAADVYAVGVMLFEMLTARHPIPNISERPIVVLRQVLKEPRRPVALLRDGLTPALRAAVDRATLPPPDGFTSAYEMLDALDASQGYAYRNSELSRALPPASTQRKVG